jgi:hypothetical protein
VSEVSYCTDLDPDLEHAPTVLESSISSRSKHAFVWLVVIEVVFCSLAKKSESTSAPKGGLRSSWLEVSTRAVRWAAAFLGLPTVPGNFETICSLLAGIQEFACQVEGQLDCLVTRERAQLQTSS